MNDDFATYKEKLEGVGERMRAGIENKPSGWQAAALILADDLDLRADGFRLHSLLLQYAVQCESESMYQAALVSLSKMASEWESNG